MPLNLCDKFYTKTLLWELKLWPDMWKNPGTDSQNLTTLNNSFQTRIKLFRSASLRRGPARINTGNKTRKTFRHPNQRVKRRRGKRTVHTRCWVPPMAFTRTSELQRICVWKNPELVTLWSPPPPPTLSYLHIILPGPWLHSSSEWHTGRTRFTRQHVHTSLRTPGFKLFVFH